VGHCQQIHAHLQMLGIIIVDSFESEPAPHNIAGVISEVCARSGVADFHITPAGSQAFQPRWDKARDPGECLLYVFGI